MHGTLAMTEPNAAAHQPVIRASFQKGRGWFIAATSPFAMHWTRRPHFVGCRHGIYESRDVECFAAERDMLNLGFETFFPVERRYKRTRQRKVERITSLFGCYGFVKFDPAADDWEQLIDLESVFDIFRNGDTPIRIPDEAMFRIQRAEDAGVFDYTTEKSPFEEGDLVEIMEGPFNGLIAKVLSAHPRKRAKLLLNTLGSLEQDPCFLRKI